MHTALEEVQIATLHRKSLQAHHHITTRNVAQTKRKWRPEPDGTIVTLRYSSGCSTPWN
jgi:hypothetical protein